MMPFTLTFTLGFTLIKSPCFNRCLLCLLMLALPGLLTAKTVQPSHSKKSAHVKKTAKRSLPTASRAATNISAAPSLRPMSTSVKFKRGSKRKSAGLVLEPHNNDDSAIADTPLAATELALASQIDVGSTPCELGTVITIKPSSVSQGYFDVQVQDQVKGKVVAQAQTYHMAPVQTRTGVLQIEDPKAGVAWLQLANKSMLMHQKLGQRLTDACVSLAQAARSPFLDAAQMQSLLDDVPAETVTRAMADTVVAAPDNDAVQPYDLALPHMSFTIE